MSDSNAKRKHGGGGEQPHKKSKKGNHGKWKTSHHKAKIATHIEMGKTFDVADEGIWVTFARGMKQKAIREFKQLCDEYGEIMYGIPNPNKENEGEDAEEEEDIEAAIQKEIGDIKAAQKPTTRQTFTPVTTPLDCLFFMKTMKPVEPVAFALRICKDAEAGTDPKQQRCRYINRLTPVITTEKATENGIDRVARTILAPHFKLIPEEGQEPPAATDDAQENNTPSTYAIRHNIRNHETFKSEAVVKRIAGMVDQEHKVNLGKPDKVILVEIFQLFCGMSVVDGPEWERLKRYNLNALYGQSSKQKSHVESQKDTSAK